jgi:hypothetical protein
VSADYSEETTVGEEGGWHRTKGPDRRVEEETPPFFVPLVLLQKNVPDWVIYKGKKFFSPGAGDRQVQYQGACQHLGGSSCCAIPWHTGKGEGAGERERAHELQTSPGSCLSTALPHRELNQFPAHEPRGMSSCSTSSPNMERRKTESAMIQRCRAVRWRNGCAWS